MADDNDNGQGSAVPGVLGAAVSGIGSGALIYHNTKRVPLLDVVKKRAEEGKKAMESSLKTVSEGHAKLPEDVRPGSAGLSKEYLDKLQGLHKGLAGDLDIHTNNASHLGAAEAALEERQNFLAEMLLETKVTDRPSLAHDEIVKHWDYRGTCSYIDITLKEVSEKIRDAESFFQEKKKDIAENSKEANRLQSELNKQKAYLDRGGKQLLGKIEAFTKNLGQYRVQLDGSQEGVAIFTPEQIQDCVYNGKFNQLRAKTSVLLRSGNVDEQKINTLVSQINEMKNSAGLFFKMKNNEKTMTTERDYARRMVTSAEEEIAYWKQDLCSRLKDIGLPGEAVDTLPKTLKKLTKTVEARAKELDVIKKGLEEPFRSIANTEYEIAEIKRIGGLSAEEVAKMKSQAAALTKQIGITEKALKDTAMHSEWERLVINRMPEQSVVTHEVKKGASAEAEKLCKEANKRETALQKLNTQYHDAMEKLNGLGEDEKKFAQKEVDKLSSRLEGAAAEHIGFMQGITEDGRTLLKNLEETVGLEKSKGSLGKAVAGGVILAGIGGTLANAVFNQKKHSHAAEIQARRQKSGMSQGTSV